MNARKFALGDIVATPGALAAIQAAAAPNPDVTLIAPLLDRYLSGDWGTVCAEDWAANDAATNPDNPSRLLASYPIGSEKTLWIITEWDRSVTTLLLPEEY